VRELPAYIREVETGGTVPKDGSTLEELEKQAILEALDRMGGNRTKAAEQLGISRRTLHRKIAEYSGIK